MAIINDVKMAMVKELLELSCDRAASLRETILAIVSMSTIAYTYHLIHTWQAPFHVGCGTAISYRGNSLRKGPAETVVILGC